MLSGQMQVMFDNIPTCAEHVKSGKLRGLAVSSTVRSEVLPDLPLETATAERISELLRRSWT